MRRTTTAVATMVMAATAAAVAIADTGQQERSVDVVVRHVPGGPERLTWRTTTASGIIQFRPGDAVRTLELPEGRAEELVLEPFPGLSEARDGRVAAVTVEGR